MFCSLSILKPGSAGTVREVCGAAGVRRRLTDIGFIEGARVECLQKSPLGDPAAYLVRGAVIVLRAEDARGVFVRLETRGKDDCDAP